MEAQELAEKFKNLKIQRETDFQEVLKWCKEHYKDLDLTDKNQHYLYEKATTYLMKYRIGKWDRDDANKIVTFLAKKSAWKLGIDENVAVKILSSDEYKKAIISYLEKTDDDMLQISNQNKNLYRKQYSYNISRQRIAELCKDML